jgi:hypothetical protein
MNEHCCVCGRHVLYDRCDDCTKAVAEWDRTRPRPAPMKLTLPDAPAADGGSGDISRHP